MIGIEDISLSTKTSTSLLFSNNLNQEEDDNKIHINNSNSNNNNKIESYHSIIKNIYLWKKISYYLKSKNVEQKSLRFSFNSNNNGKHSKKVYSNDEYRWMKYDEIKSVKAMVLSNNVGLLKDKLKCQKELIINHTQDTRTWVRHLEYDLFVSMFYRYREMIEKKCFIIDLAVESRDLEKIKMLHNVDIKMKRGTHYNISYASKTAMDISARYGELEIVKFLNENRTEDCSENAIDYAAFHGHLDVVKYLFSHNKPYSNRAIEGAAEQGHYSVVKFLTNNQNPPQFRPFVIEAVKNKGYNDIVLLLEKSLKQTSSNNGSGGRVFSNWFIRSN